MIGGALVAAGATNAAVIVLGVAVLVAIVGGVHVWRTRPWVVSLRTDLPIWRAMTPPG
jgi:hypothetical protein